MLKYDTADAELYLTRHLNCTQALVWMQHIELQACLLGLEEFPDGF